MIVDFHAHVFPPKVVASRDGLCAREPVFRELYASPKAKLATAPELSRSMDEAGVDVSVALGFAWRDAGACRSHNDYLLEAAAAGGGRLVPFCTLPLGAPWQQIEDEARRCVEAGARGFGELRPGNLGFDLAGEQGRLLGELAQDLRAILLFHASEPVGHLYAGKQGLELPSLYAFAAANPGARLVAAHWGGGLPFYALMPEVRVALADAYFDTAASSLLYEPAVYAEVCRLVGAERVLFGSDYPLLSQAACLRRVREAGLGRDAEALVLGGSAARLLGLS